MTEIGVQYVNFTTRIWKENIIQSHENTDMPRFVVSNRNSESKCFSFIMPYVEKIPIVSFFIRINANIFPSGKRPSFPNFHGSNISGGGFSVFLHLPGEHLRSYFDKKHTWANRQNNTNNYDMIFTVKNMEVLKRRNKFTNPCNTNWENDDESVMESIMNGIGCTPPHWKLKSRLRSCSTREEMRKFRWPTYQDLQNFPLPCNVIEKVHYDYEDVDSVSLEDEKNEKNQNVTSWFGVTLFFPEPSYKEIKQAQAYNIESFVGNAGGYIGLFLGYSLMCIPKLIVKMFRKAKEYRENRVSKISANINESYELTNQSSDVTVSISGLNKTCNQVIKGTRVANAIDMSNHINQQQLKMESKVEEIETKLDFVYPAYVMTLDNSVNPENLALWNKRRRFYLSDEVLIK
jgi:hypothetical protein